MLDINSPTTDVTDMLGATPGEELGGPIDSSEIGLMDREMNMTSGEKKASDPVLAQAERDLSSADPKVRKNAAEILLAHFGSQPNPGGDLQSAIADKYSDIGRLKATESPAADINIPDLKGSEAKLVSQAAYELLTNPETQSYDKSTPFQKGQLDFAMAITKDNLADGDLSNDLPAGFTPAAPAAGDNAGSSSGVADLVAKSEQSIGAAQTIPTSGQLLGATTPPPAPSPMRPEVTSQPAPKPEVAKKEPEPTVAKKESEPRQDVVKKLDPRIATAKQLKAEEASIPQSKKPGSKLAAEAKKPAPAASGPAAIAKARPPASPAVTSGPAGASNLTMEKSGSAASDDLMSGLEQALNRLFPEGASKPQVMQELAAAMAA